MLQRVKTSGHTQRLHEQKAPRLSAVIPIGTGDFDFYEQRLLIRDGYDLTGVETIVVDDGSAPGQSNRIEAFCNERDYVYIRNGEHSVFSSPRARNAGIFAASSEWIIQEDADVIYERNFYQKIVREVELLQNTPLNFLTVPTVYVKEGLSAAIRDEQAVEPYSQEILTHLAFEDPRGSDENLVIQHYAPASGILIFRRDDAELAGGYDDTIEGWGGEDRDFAFRLLLLNSRMPRPHEFEQTKKWNLNDTVAFEGWRAQYRLVGDYLALKGIYGFHLHHERQPWRGTHSRDNIAYASAKARQISVACSEQASADASPATTAPFDKFQETILFDRYRHHEIASKRQSEANDTHVALKANQSSSETRIALIDRVSDAPRRAYAEGRWADAARGFERASLLFAQAVEPLRCAAEAYDHLKDYHSARRLIGEALKLAPDNKNLRRRAQELRQGPIARLFSKHKRFDVPKPQGFQ